MKDSVVINLVRVRFPGQASPGIFLAGPVPMEYGQRVVAMSERGLAIGFINSQVYEAPASAAKAEIPSITRVASDEDVIQYKGAYQIQREAWKIFNLLAEEFDLNLKLEDLEFTSQGKKIVFSYTAPDRVDFRDLLKALKHELKSEIELRQVSTANDRTTEIGPCGPDLCLFINNFNNGPGAAMRCSENFCCLEENDRFYEDKRSRLPRAYSIIETKTDEVGKVLSVDFVREEFEMLTDQGIVKRYTSENFKKNLNRKVVNFPKSFETISYENNVVIGNEERLAKKQQDEERESAKSDISAKEFSERVWRDINQD